MPFRVVPFRDRLLNRSVKRAEPEQVSRGRVLLERGAPADTVLLLLDGHLRVREAGEGEGGRTVDVVLPWEIVGIEALIDEERAYRWSVEAGEGSRVARLDGRAVRRVLRRSERTLDAFLDAVLARMTLNRDLGPGVSHASAAQRLWRVLQELAGRSDPPDPGDPWVIRARITHRDLGDLAGIHRSTVTTQLNDWLFHDLLESTNGGWSIPELDPGGLV